MDNAWVLMHMETMEKAVSRLHQSLSSFEVGFVIREASLDHASDLATYRLTVLLQFMWSGDQHSPCHCCLCLYAECQSAARRFTLFGVTTLGCVTMWGVADRLIATQLSSSSS